MNDHKSSKAAFYERQAGEIIPHAPSSLPRLQLSEAVPLDTPLAVEITPVHACNLRCEYCIWALEEKNRGYLSDAGLMPHDIYCQAIDGLKEFPRKLALCRIAGAGEPLMHPEIDKLVRYAVDYGGIERVEIVTNAILLTRELSDKLIDAGLTRLRVSIQGNTAEAYEKHSKRAIDYDKFTDNLEYYYKRRGGSKLYVKVMDYMLEDEEDVQRFIQRFEPISDALQIEHIAPFVKGIDYRKLTGGQALNKRQVGGEIHDVAVCALPFYMLMVKPDGNVFPCCAAQPPPPPGKRESAKHA
jgi:MoaA/NifB/PqqE/SkfB family radical SAM enzyme